MRVLDALLISFTVSVFDYNLGNFWNQDRKDFIMNKEKSWDETWSKQTC